MFVLNITPEAEMSECWELDKNSLITCNLYNTNKKCLLNIFHIEMSHFKMVIFLAD